ncbi:MAG: endonuclease domain-containing protein [Prevotella sp.]|nr:endonuclease domain-containing protein [Prevotella sp.]
MERRHETAAPDRYDLLKAYARHNRHEMTESEQTLWAALRKEFGGIKFRRQHPIGDYIADFLCLTRKLVIEVDGGYHNDPQQRIEDVWRTEFLESKNYRVLRFTNEEVNTDTRGVISRIKEELIKIEDSYEQ